MALSIRYSKTLCKTCASPQRARNEDRLHPGSQCRLQSTAAVFQDEAVLRRHAHSLCGQQEHVRRGFAMLHIHRRDDVVEEMEEAGVLQTGMDDGLLAAG